MLYETEIRIVASLFYFYGSVALFNAIEFDTLSITFYFFGSLFYFISFANVFWRDIQPNSNAKRSSCFKHGGIILGNLFFLIGSLLLWINSNGGAICYIIGSLIFIGDCIYILKTTKCNTFTCKRYLPLSTSVAFLVGSILFLPQINIELTSILFFLFGSVLEVAEEIYDIQSSSRIGWLCLSAFGLFAELIFLLKLEWLMDPKASRWLNYIAFAASICGIVTNIPQIVHTYNSGRVRNFSTLSLFLWTVSAAIWLGYSILAKSYALIFTNFVSLFTASFLLSYKRVEIKK